MTRFLGAILILGSVLVSAILVWVLGAYQQEGQLADGWLVLIGLVLAAVLVLPQLGFGIYLLRSTSPAKDTS